MNAVPAIPPGRACLAPYLCCRDAARAISFYKRVFGAEEKFRLDDGKRIGHAELCIGGAVLMLADEFPEMDVLGPRSLGGSPVTIHLYVEDVDAVFAAALAAGAETVREVETQFYGDRGGKLRDPFGHVWWIATHVEDVSPDEIRRRAAELFGSS